MWQEMALFESNVFRRAGGVLGSQRNGLHRQYALAHVEPMTGIEPAYSAWEADVLPLNYIGTVLQRIPRPAGPSISTKPRCCPPDRNAGRPRIGSSRAAL